MPDQPCLFIAHQALWDVAWDDFRLPSPDHPWLIHPMLRRSLYAQLAVQWAAAVRRAMAMRNAGYMGT